MCADRRSKKELSWVIENFSTLIAVLATELSNYTKDLSMSLHVNFISIKKNENIYVVKLGDRKLRPEKNVGNLKSRPIKLKFALELKAEKHHGNSNY